MQPPWMKIKWPIHTEEYLVPSLSLTVYANECQTMTHHFTVHGKCTSQPWSKRYSYIIPTLQAQFKPSTNIKYTVLMRHSLPLQANVHNFHSTVYLLLSSFLFIKKTTTLLQQLSSKYEINFILKHSFDKTI